MAGNTFLPSKFWAEKCLWPTKIMPLEVSQSLGFESGANPTNWLLKKNLPRIDNKADSVQLQLQLPTGTELGKN